MAASAVMAPSANGVSRRTSTLSQARPSAPKTSGVALICGSRASE